MSADGSMYAKCDMCEVVAFDPRPCCECIKTDPTSALCTAHYHECAECTEPMCADHSVVKVIDGESQLVCKDCAADLENKEQGESERAFERTLSGDTGPTGASYRAAMKDAGRGHLLP